MNSDNKATKKKLPKKKGRLLREKPIVVFGIVAAVAIAGIIGGITIFISIPEEKILYISYSDLAFLDPHQTWVPDDYEIINQVTEGLFAHNSTNGQSQIIHNLAVSHSWNVNATELTCQLRRFVRFHDGTRFDAEAVQWNIDRIYTLIDNGKMHFGVAQYWLFSDGMHIINKTEIIDYHKIKFILNKPYIPLTALLASANSFIVSPASTPKDDFIDKYTGALIGTGPFMFEVYNEFHSIIFSSNPNYWGGIPKFDKLIFKFC